MSSLLLLLITLLYAGYNLLVKVSSDYVPAQATTTVLATVCLQIAALTASLSFTVYLLTRGGHVLQLSGHAYAWAAAAGLCIGIAEIGYFYLFGGIGNIQPIAANIAIPAIVSGTVVITIVVSYFVFRESLSWIQLLGGGFVLSGIALMYVGKGQ